MSAIVTSPGELSRLHVEALYRRDGDGRMVESNEAEPQEPPRVFIVRTEAGVICHLRRSLDPSLAAEVERLARELPLYPEGRGAVELYAGIEEAVTRDAPIAFRWHGIAYDFAEPPREIDPEVVEITDDRSGLVGHFADFQSTPDEMPPFLAIVREGTVASGCYSARLTDVAAEAGVDTDPVYRGQGLAAAVVNAWRATIEAAGRTALYSTSYDNVSSQAVARRLGLRQYAETLSLR